MRSLEAETRPSGTGVGADESCASVDDNSASRQVDRQRIAQRILAAMRAAGYSCELNDDPRVA